MLPLRPLATLGWPWYFKSKAYPINQLYILQSVVARNETTSLELSFQEESNICDVSSDLHIGSRESLNIQSDTFRNGSLINHQDPQGPAPCRSVGSTHYFTPKIMVSNVMSLVLKMSEVSEFILCNQVSLAFITETWLKSSVCDSVIDIPGYSVLRKDCSSESHGGICFYLKGASYKRLNELSCCQDHEILWVKLRPKRLPRVSRPWLLELFTTLTGLQPRTTACMIICFSRSFLQ